jgi:hypothetical protein
MSTKWAHEISVVQIDEMPTKYERFKDTQIARDADIQIYRRDTAFSGI